MGVPLGEEGRSLEGVQNFSYEPSGEDTEPTAPDLAAPSLFGDFIEKSFL